MIEKPQFLFRLIKKLEPQGVWADVIKKAGEANRNV